MRSPLDTYRLPAKNSGGVFGAMRKFDVHTGIDLYCEHMDPVYAIERGRVLTVCPFTGPRAGSYWWHDTDAIVISGSSGIILYGELTTSLKPGDLVEEGQLIGLVKTVLKKDKGLPMTMLHLELYDHGYEVELGGDAGVVWQLGSERPAHLLDPTTLINKI